MKPLSFVSIYEIINQINRNYPNISWSDTEIIEWAGEALGLIGAVPALEDAIAFIEVANHQCGMPCAIQQIVGIAKNERYVAEDAGNTAVVAGELTEEGGETYPVPIDCNGKPITGVELAYYRPYFDLRYETGEWLTSSRYSSDFVPVRLSENIYMDAISCDNDPSPYAVCQYEYKIVPKTKILRFSFESGQIALAYKRTPIDDNGYPMIPDIESYRAAIQAYCIYRKMAMQFYGGDEGGVSRFQKAEADWQWYCGQAGSAMMMPNGLDEIQNMMDIKQKLIPRMFSYYDFFGRIAHPEDRAFNNPDNRSGYGLRGYNY